MNHVGFCLNVGDAVLRLNTDIELGRVGHDQVCFNIRLISQHFHQADAVRQAAGAGHTDNNSFHGKKLIDGKDYPMMTRDAEISELNRSNLVRRFDAKEMPGLVRGLRGWRNSAPRDLSGSAAWPGSLCPG